MTLYTGLARQVPSTVENQSVQLLTKRQLLVPYHNSLANLSLGARVTHGTLSKDWMCF